MPCSRNSLPCTCVIENFGLTRAFRDGLPNVQITGKVLANGGAGGAQLNDADGGGGGAGAGGTIWVRTGTLKLTGTLSATGGKGGVTHKSGAYGGDGGAASDGRIRLDYNSMTGSGKVTPKAGYHASCQ